jgi:hypothetical protein
VFVVNKEIDMQKKALLIGINYLGTENQLEGCANDVKDMKVLLMKNGFKEKDIIVLSDDIKGAIYPSRDNILNNFSNFVSNAKPDDDLFVHYSGHGSQEEDLDNSESDHMDEAICPATGDFIIDDELKDIIKKVPIGARLFGLFDCCHSATILDLQHNLVQGSNKKPLRNHGFTVMISGCKDAQTSADAQFQGHNQGALTAAFFQRVKKSSFDNVMNICFSNVTSKLVDLQKQLNSWLKAHDFDQIPNIAYEGTMILNTYKTFATDRGRQHNLRQVPSRNPDNYHSKAVLHNHTHANKAKKSDPMEVKRLRFG